MRRNSVAKRWEKHPISLLKTASPPFSPFKKKSDKEQGKKDYFFYLFHKKENRYFLLKKKKNNHHKRELDDGHSEGGSEFSYGGGVSGAAPRYAEHGRGGSVSSAEATEEPTTVRAYFRKTLSIRTGAEVRSHDQRKAAVRAPAYVQPPPPAPGTIDPLVAEELAGLPAEVVRQVAEAPWLAKSLKRDLMISKTMQRGRGPAAEATSSSRNREFWTYGRDKRKDLIPPKNQLDEALERRRSPKRSTAAASKPMPQVRPRSPEKRVLQSAIAHTERHERARSASLSPSRPRVVFQASVAAATPSRRPASSSRSAATNTPTAATPTSAKKPRPSTATREGKKAQSPFLETYRKLLDKELEDRTEK